MAIGATGTDTVWDIYRRCAENHRHSALLFIDATGEIQRASWETVAHRAGAVAAQLRAVGIRRGDRVAIHAANCPEFPVLLGATSLLGAIAVPLNVLLAAPELAYQLSDVEPAALIAGPGMSDAASAALDQTDLRPARLAIDTAPGWDSLKLDGEVLDGPPERVDHMDPFQILFTSGTTARPKGVLHSHRNILEEALRQAYQWSLRPDDVLFTHMPLFHVAGQNLALYPAMSVGATAAIGGAFSASRWAEDLRTTGATVVPVAGAQIRMIMAQSGKNSDADNSLRLIPAGIAVPLDMENAFMERFDAPVRAISGSTESIAVSYCEPVWGEHRHPALGRPTYGKEVEIRDEQGNPVPFGTPGELCVRGERGAQLMLGYWNRSEETEKTLEGGWLHTGDIGVMDEDGFIFFVDRKKDIIKRSGENVSASEVERVLLELGGVREAAVVGRPDPIRDEAVVAFVTLDADGPSVEKMIAHCATNLAKFKVPEEITVLEALPVTSIGKIEKGALRAKARGES